jgi:lysophospholipase L1-like esterase
MKKNYLALLTLATIASLAACGSGGGGNVPQLVKGTGAATAPTPLGGPMLIGVGDSLTAGEQSDALLGAPTTSSLSAYPGGSVYPGQVSGWFADMYDCLNATGGVCNHTPFSLVPPSTLPNNPSDAVLPLIRAPGVGTQIVLNATTGFANTQSGCSAFNDSAFGAGTWTGTRENPTAGLADLGVPGITMHETIYMNGPYEGPPTQSTSGCGYATLPNDPTSGGLQSLVEAENLYFLPVLGGYYPAYGSNLTELNVAVGMKPKLTTVWLGANDLLKFIFSAGTAPASDTPTQMAADLTKIVSSLTATGSKVLIADLPTLLPTTGNPVPQFFPQTKLSADLQALGIPAAAAGAIVSYVGTTYGVTTGGYLTETGMLDVVEGCASAPATCTTPKLDPGGAGTGLGSAYLTPAFAAEVQALNAGYNQAIDGVAQQFAAKAPGQVALVSINTFFTQASTTGVTIPGLPGPLTLQFGGGLVSWDGLHPSNAGYAEIANYFIATADAPAASGGLGMTIPQLALNQLLGIVITDPYDPYVLKAGNPQSPFPLP